MRKLSQFRMFCDALYDYVQEPGWFMMGPANASYMKSRRIAAWFEDNQDDIESLFKQYLKTDGAVKTDFDLSMKDIVNSESWRKAVRQYIADLGQFSGDSHVLLGAGL